jgi:protease-4
MKKRWIVLIVLGFLFLSLIFGIGLRHYLFYLYPGIGYVEVRGTIFDSRRTVKWINQLRKDPRVKAILVRIDSPGGGVAASQEIYGALMKAKEEGKPVVAFLGTVAASGGYYIACAADKIVSNPGTITGSIGVIMEFPVVERLLEKIGLEFEIIKSSEHKDIGSPFRPMTPKERKLMEEVVMDVYDQFIDVVVNSRGIPRDSLKKIADGRILSGKQALNFGLVDMLGVEEDAIEEARKLGGIVGKPRLIRMKKRRASILDILLRLVDEFFKPVDLKYIMEVPSD